MLKKPIALLLIVLSIISCVSLVSIDKTSSLGVTITIETSIYTQLIKAKSIGVNVEASFIPDDYWTANGNFMTETFNGTGIKIARWGYNMWNWDWKINQPIDFAQFWVPENACTLQEKNASTTLELREFLDYCRDNGVIPIIMMPCEEALNTATWEQLRELSGRMAAWINNIYSFSEVFFEVGNEPWIKGITKEDYVLYLKEIYPIIKKASSDFKVLASIETGSWSDFVITNAWGFYDAVDYHHYLNIPNSWGGYYETDSNFGGYSLTVRSGIISILGETNVLWPDWSQFPYNYGGCLPMIEHLLKTIGSNTFDYILTWPSHFTKNTKSSSDAIGMFNYNEWEHNKKTVRLNGEILSKRLVNEAVLDRKASSISSDVKVRTYAYTDNLNSIINLVAVNKRDVPVDVIISLPSSYGYVNAMVVEGVSLTDKNSQYTAHIIARSTAGTSYTNILPGRSVVLFTFYNDSSDTSPGSFFLSDPANSSTGVSTMKDFKWTSSSGVKNYRLTVSTNSSFNNPIIDMDVGNVTHFQWTGDLLYNTKYYWKVVGSNKSGSTNAKGNGDSFTTAEKYSNTETCRGKENDV